MRLDDFDYHLPPERIAQEPLPERDTSRLLVLDRAGGGLRHHRFRDLPGLLAPGDLLVVNRSRVFAARLLGTRAGGGKAEVLLVRARHGDVWEALLRPARKLPPGARVRVDEELEVEVLEEPARDDGRRLVRILARSGDPSAALERLGRVPLPPYIRRPDVPADRARYQTVYANERGSVAAPTAGLHFTAALLGALSNRGVERAEVVLHVGPGTFRPVKVWDVREHVVAAEPFVLPPETAAAVARTRARGGRVVAVGTTTTRVLEARADDSGHVAPGAGETSLVIVPGFRFRAVDALVTNFHLPRSSLLLLASAFAGRERVLAAYAQAVREGYRFYSYGDAMLVV
ncbi:MAG TPA: tRNA preQ1(34) S-adenosylmethionine ribosyltransferase-isomerase QueA [Vicinamibacteria bacterium]|nr:tRNA preQ1(34) S-adenosylmethionine ribosyltransferase-isomerase QueA [Vicinamibacteria bacterium]